MTARAYFDHAATSPMVDEAVSAMTAQLTRVGNASAVHGSGRAARRVVEEGRESIASRLGARPGEVVFTSGGTEANNLALKGAFWAQRGGRRRGVVTSAIEHRAVLDPVAWLEKSEGADVDLLKVNQNGVVSYDALDRAITDHTVVASLIWANNEIGTQQPVAALAELARERGAVSHSDAVQAVGHVEVDFAASGLDLLTCTAHKLGGPYGIGALLVRRELTLTATQHGGGQERDLRSGTFDVAAVAGFAAALEVAAERLEVEQARVGALRQELVAGVLARVPDVVVNGGGGPGGLPGIVNLGFPGCVADTVLMLLDGAGIDCSTGSACSAGVSQASHVLLALGRSEADARSALRFSLGWTTTAADVQRLLDALPEAVSRARAAAAVSTPA